MKIAVCLSGHLRSFQQTYKRFQESITDNFDCDVFVHTWDCVGFSGHIDGHLVRVPTISVLDEVARAYNQKHIIVERFQPKNGEQYRKYLVDNRSPSGVITMFYKVEEAHKMALEYSASSNTKYDIYIRCRPDIDFLSKLNKKELEIAASEDKLFVPHSGHYTGLNDQFAFGNEKVMSLYSSLYSNLDNIIDESKMVPESLMKHHVLKNNLNIELSNIKYVIKRVNGEIFSNDFHSPNPPDLSLK